MPDGKRMQRRQRKEQKDEMHKGGKKGTDLAVLAGFMGACQPDHR